MPCDLTIIVKNEEKKFSRDFLIYESLTLDETNPILKQYISDTVAEFVGEPTDIKIKATMVWL